MLLTSLMHKLIFIAQFHIVQWFLGTCMSHYSTNYKVLSTTLEKSNLKGHQYLNFSLRSTHFLYGVDSDYGGVSLYSCVTNTCKPVQWTTGPTAEMLVLLEV